jgi:hypothetical protein
MTVSDKLFFRLQITIRPYAFSPYNYFLIISSNYSQRNERIEPRERVERMLKLESVIYISDITLLKNFFFCKFRLIYNTVLRVVSSVVSRDVLN